MLNEKFRSNHPAREGIEDTLREDTAKARIAIAVILAAVAWVAYFSQFGQMGLYEDDYAFIGSPMTWHWASFVGAIRFYLTTWPQGRPIGFAAVCAIAFLGNRIGGIHLIQFVAFGLQFINAYFVYAIGRRTLAAAPALCAALGFCLFPSNTSVPLLTNALFGGLTLLFLLMAVRLYLSGRRGLAYFVSAGSLLTYESAFLPFFAAPLLQRKHLPELRRNLLKHWAILLLIGAVLLSYRTYAGEAKTVELANYGPIGGLERVMTAVVVGPLTTLRLFVSRLFTVWHDGSGEVLLVALLSGIALAAAVYFFRVQVSERMERWPVTLTNRWFEFRAAVNIDESSAEAVRTVCVGAVMLCCAYGLAITQFYYPPVIDAGRLTFVHLAAAFGGGLLCGGLCALLLNIGRNRIWAALLIGFYFGGLVGFHYLVQQDFRKSWSIQREFWKAVVEKCPDLEDGTILLYEAEPLSLHYVLASSWTDPLVLGELFDFPQNWKQRPRLFSVSKTWTDDVTPQGDEFRWQLPPGPWAAAELLPKNNVILLRGAPGPGLWRVTGTVTINSRQFPLKSSDAAKLTFQRGGVYGLLIGP